jgi:hypothetical protein
MASLRSSIAATTAAAADVASLAATTAAGYPCVPSVAGSRKGVLFLVVPLVFGGVHAVPPILWLAGAPSDSYRRRLRAEAGHFLARCPLPPYL